MRASSKSESEEEEDGEGEINSAECDDEELDTLSTSPSSSLSTDHDVVLTKRHYDNQNPNMPTINLQQILNSEWYNDMVSSMLLNFLINLSLMILI